jgi:triosephosphate isomerase
MAQRRPIAAANWKMNLLRRDADDYCQHLASDLGDPDAEVLIFPPATLLPTVADGLAGTVAACGGQDLHPAASGAHTGDLSGVQLADVGCTWVLCGHSERRKDHNESDALVGRKALAANEHGLVPLICLGESDEERRAGRTFEVLRRQLHAALETTPAAFELAYEPVWAIGTGATATPEIAQEAHAFLRRQLAVEVGEARAQATRILYGGSVKPENAAELIAPEDIDGFLVGGASLDSAKFLAIIMACGASARV